MPAQQSTTKSPNGNSYFVPGYSISRVVIQNEIRYHIGPDAIVRPYIPPGRDGCLVTTGGQPLTHKKVNDPKYDGSQCTPHITRRLVIDEGSQTHVDPKDETRLPYEHMKLLGHGASAIVEKVRDINTGRVFARKVFKINHSRSLSSSRDLFQNEVAILRRLAAHHHITTIYATYICRRELALILHPVADGGDLANFLQDYKDRDSPLQDKTTRDIVFQAFGCLASGLEYIHMSSIRHKDIKPKNILVHQGRVLYTDFGISIDFGDAGHSTTTGHSLTFTRRYCSPEVTSGNNRNTKSDIFSLGCVFVEMFSALFPSLIPDDAIKQPYSDTIAQYKTPIFLPNIDQIPAHHGVILLLRTMLHITPSERPTATAVVRELSIAGAKDYFCETCREAGEPGDL